MPGLAQEVRAVYNAATGGHLGVRHVVAPASGVASVQLTAGAANTYGVYAALAAAAAITTDYWPYGGLLADLTVFTDEDYWAAVASGAAGAGGDLGGLGCHVEQDTAVGYMSISSGYFGPKLVTANLGLAGRVGTQAGASKINLRAFYFTGLF